MLRTAGYPVRGDVPAVACLLPILLLLFFAGPLPAQEAGEDSGPKPPKLFESNATLPITLSAPWKDIVRKADVQDPYPATLEFTDDSGQRVTLPLTVERRGITRQIVCKYPPIRLRFDKEVVKGTMWRGQDSIKMVTHCDKGDRWEQYYIKELMAYHFYNQITDISFRARALEVTYVESSSGSPEDPRFAFLIEDDSDVAKRNGMKKNPLARIEPEQLQPMETSRLMLFQYLIGNVDFEVLSSVDPTECCHNTRLISAEGATSDIIAIPYDFDSSGLVDAHYAAPNEHLPINVVTDRLFRGFCVHKDTLEPARQEVLAKEAAIYAVIESETRLNNRNRKIVTKYTDEFFEDLKNPKLWDKNIKNVCRR